MQSQNTAPDAALIQLLTDLRPTHGAVGSRDVDVTAQQGRIDAAIAVLNARPFATISNSAQPGRDAFELWAKGEGHTNFMHMAGDDTQYDDLILRAQYKAYQAGQSNGISLERTVAEAATPIPLTYRDAKLSALIAEIRAAHTMAFRDSLFEKLIEVFEGTPNDAFPPHYDPRAVYDGLADQAKSFTTPENVVAVLDSLARMQPAGLHPSQVDEGESAPLPEAGEYDVNGEPHLLFTADHMHEHRRGGYQIGFIRGTQSRSES